jgi:1-deoxyxylulose-5-phosphate synthase
MSGKQNTRYGRTGLRSKLCLGTMTFGFQCDAAQSHAILDAAAAGGIDCKHILDAIDTSLRRLGTDYVDIYQLHGYDALTLIDEALDAHGRAQRQGPIRRCVQLAGAQSR